MQFAGGKLKRADTLEHLDDFAIVATRKFAVVARGHAGYDAPLASRVIATLTDAIGPRVDVAAIRADTHALNETFAREAQDAEWSYGASFAAAWFVGESMFVLNVGESEVWLCTSAGCEIVAEPQTLVTELVRAGQLTRDEALQFEHSNVLVNVLGNGGAFRFDIIEHKVVQSSLVLLSTSPVDARDRECLVQHGARDPHYVARRVAENHVAREPKELSTACVVIAV